MIVNVPAPLAPLEYSRARQLFLIATIALTQLEQDARAAEQEDLALTSRLNAINIAVEEIRRNDPLLK